MIKIIIKDFNFELIQTHGPFFDLSILTTINANKPTERQEMQIVAHGILFEEGMKKIISLLLDNSNKIFNSLHEYIIAYKEISEKISKLITTEESNLKTDE